MKPFHHLLLVAATTGLSLTSAVAQNPDSTSLPGDQFSLEAALELFKKAPSPEAFEKSINTENNDANNLDLNGDGETDYIKVIDKVDGDVHTIVLQVALSETEDQDIAVIELEKTGERTAILQIVGDEDIFGEETIVEPSDENSAGIDTDGNAGIVRGPKAESLQGLIVNVWLWPSVKYVYAPGYAVWHSPFRWKAHPAWWRPWHPLRPVVFYPRGLTYKPHYVVVHTYRVNRGRSIYRPARVTSVTVVRRNQASVGQYRANRSVQRSTVTGPSGHVQATRTTTTITGKHGNKVKRTKTKIRKR